MDVLTIHMCLTLLVVSTNGDQKNQNNMKGQEAENLLALDVEINSLQSISWIPTGWTADINGSMLILALPLKMKPSKNRYGNPRSCSEIKAKTQKSSDGVYTIYPLGTKGTRDYCDMTTDGGGWTVFQRRYNGTTDFDRDWKSYKEGFGEPDTEYWLGNSLVHHLTKKGKCTLRIDMKTTYRDTGYAVYKNFSIGSEEEAYRLSVGTYSGTAGEKGGGGLTYQNMMKFSTKDHDNDFYEGNCASTHKSGFWFKKCAYVTLNGPYGGGRYKWALWKNTNASRHLTKSKMMLRC